MGWRSRTPSSSKQEITADVTLSYLHERGAPTSPNRFRFFFDYFVSAVKMQLLEILLDQEEEGGGATARKPSDVCRSTPGSLLC